MAGIGKPRLCQNETQRFHLSIDDRGASLYRIIERGDAASEATSHRFFSLPLE